MPNLFSTFALVFWPAIAIILYLTLPFRVAAIWIVLLAQLLLPVGAVIKFEMIPQLDKNSIPNLCVLVGCVVLAKQPFTFFPRPRILQLLILTYFIAPLITSQLNGDAIIVGERILPGVGLYDSISALESAFILLIPFLVGRQFLRRAVDIESIFKILVSAEIFYSFLLLFEIRFSPQLHFWIYGYYPSDFIQAVRGDGSFRPIAFMDNGLTASFFLMMSVLGSAALWRNRMPILRLPSISATSYLSMVLILSKSLGATIYSFIFVPIIRWSTPKLQMRLAIVLVVLSTSYPLARTFDIFPTSLLINLAETLSQDRAESLKFRFDNEDKLLARALERPIFGWGRFGRSRVYDENGKDVSVTDGRWIITIGQLGLFGFIAEFGLLALSIIRASSALKFAKSYHDKIFLAALSLIVSICMVDLLPNGGLYPWTWLLCGSLLGRAEMILADRVRGQVRMPNYSASGPLQHLKT